MPVVRGDNAASVRAQALAAAHVNETVKPPKTPRPVAKTSDFADPIATLPVKHPAPLEQNTRKPWDPYHSDRKVAPLIHGTPSRNSINADALPHHVLNVLANRESIYGKPIDSNRTSLHQRDAAGHLHSVSKTQVAGGGAFDSPVGAVGGVGLSLAKLALAQLGQRAVDNPKGLGAAVEHPIRTAEQAGRNTLQTLHDPLGHPGDAALLAWALASGGASGLARLGGAAGALRAGEGVGAAVGRSGAAGGSLLHSPEPGTLKLTTEGGQTVEYSASKNVVARQVQKGRNARLQSTLDKGAPEKAPRTKAGKAVAGVTQTFGAEAKVRRETRANRRIEEALANGPLGELHAATKRLSREEHVALRVSGIEGHHALEHPVETIQRHIAKATDDFHKGAITSDEYHAELADLKLASSVLSKPSPEFRNAVDKTRAISERTKQMLVDRGFLDESTANGRLAKIANLYHHPRALPDEPIYPEGSMFHGSPDGKLGEIDTLYHTRPWREGPGFYATTDAAKAAKYAAGKTATGERRTGVGAINVVKLHPGAKVLDMDSATPDFWRGVVEHVVGEKIDPKVYAQWANDITDAEVKGASPGIVNRLRALHMLTGWAELPKSDAYYAIEDALHEMGYQATKHTENGVPVYVVKDAAAIKRVSDHEIVTRKGGTTPAFSEPPPGSFYFPLSRRYTHALNTVDQVSFGGQRPSELGSPEPSVSGTVGSLQKQFTGRSLESHLPADIVARGLGQRYARTVRLSSAHDLFHELYTHGSDVKTSEYQVPFRSTARARTQIQDVLAKASDTLAHNPDAEELLTKQEIDALHQAVNADEYQGVPVGTRVEGVKWVDKRFVPEIETNMRSAVAKLTDAVNNPFRAATLYARPAYALNALGNASMAAITEGHLAPVAIKRALTISKDLGSADTAAIRAGMGSTRTESYLLKGSKTDLSHKLADGWNKITDVWYRDSAFFHEADRAGYKSPQQVAQLLHDPALKSKRIEVFRRAKKNAVDYDSLSPVEKNVIRRVIYFYPWVSRATVWSLRTLVEHPGKTYTVAALARVGAENMDKRTGPMPPWAHDIGYIPIGPQTHRPVTDKNGRTTQHSFQGLINPSSVNTFGSAEQTIHSGLDTIKGLIGVGKGGGAARSLTPGLQMLAQQAGAPDPSQTPGLLGALESLPQTQAARRLGLWGKPSKTFPDQGPGPAFGPLGAGGLFPRQADQDVLAAGYRKGLSKSARAGYDLQQHLAAVNKAAKAGQITPQDATSYRDQLKAGYRLQKRILQITGGAKKFGLDKSRLIVIAQAAVENHNLETLNQTLSDYGLPPATQQELDAERNRK